MDPEIAPLSDIPDIDIEIETPAAISAQEPEKASVLPTRSLFQKSAGLFHLCVMIFVPLYLCFNRVVWIDMASILILLLVLLSWTFLNGECPITYISKLYSDPDYQAGNDNTDIEDILFIFGGNELLQNIFIKSALLAIAVSLFILLKRNNCPIYVYGLTPAVFLAYIFSFRYFTDIVHNIYFHRFQECIKVFLVFVICTTVYCSWPSLINNPVLNIIPFSIRPGEIVPPLQRLGIPAVV
jgi:hypothetical protein